MATLTKDYIINLLATNDRAVARALIALNERQTEFEQKEKMTIDANGRGFKSCHGQVGTEMAKSAIQFGSLTQRQVAWWRERNNRGKMRIECYAGQLLSIAMEKQKVA